MKKYELVVHIPQDALTDYDSPCPICNKQIKKGECFQNIFVAESVNNYYHTKEIVRAHLDCVETIQDSELRFRINKNFLKNVS